MASTCIGRIRSSSHTPLSSLRSHIKPRASAPVRPSVPTGSASPEAHLLKAASPTRRFTSSSRCPSELGCCWTMFPLHSAVAAARLTSCLSSASRNCRALSQEIGLSVPR